MELIGSISRTKGKLRPVFFIITFTQGAVIQTHKQQCVRNIVSSFARALRDFSQNSLLKLFHSALQ